MKLTTLSVLIFSFAILNTGFANDFVQSKQLVHSEKLAESVKQNDTYNIKQFATDCQPATSQAELNVNNVRATILNGGDKWWDLNSAGYEIPKVDPLSNDTPVYSYFAGAIWLGGLDAGGQLKIAAQTYRQTGHDFWPGPLDNKASVTAQVCEEYDRHWSVRATEIDQARAAAAAYLANIGDPNAEVNLDPADLPQSILEWPAIGNPHAVNAQGGTLNVNDALAPFYDYDKNGTYDPTKGDYPLLNYACTEGYPDQMIFWTINDMGNQHTATNGEAIGVQVNATAFAFVTDDEINDMTFYQYRLINKSSNPLYETYFGNWADPDLGCYNTDYIGCDTSRNLGIVYNGLANDPDCATKGYGENPPISGIAILSSPKNDNGEEIGMSGFVYYNNDFSPMNGNPVTAQNHYNYLRGVWADGTPITEGGNGTTGTVPTPYMFSGNPSDAGGWSECSENNPPGDRTFIQSSGPFTFMPGEVQQVVSGVIWVQIPDVYPCPNFNQTIGPATDKALAFFDTTCIISSVEIPQPTISELVVFPNPVKSGSTIHLNFNADFTTTGKIELFNMQGQKIYNRSVEFNTGFNREKIALGKKHSSGVYILKVSSGKNSVSKKLILTGFE